MATPPRYTTPPTTPAAPPTAAPPQPRPAAPAPAPAEETTPETKMRLNIHGAPPASHMADEQAPASEHMGDITKAELEAGRKALKDTSSRHNAEQEAGRKAIAHLQRVTPESKKEAE